MSKKSDIRKQLARIGIENWRAMCHRQGPMDRMIALNMFINAGLVTTEQDEETGGAFLNAPPGNPHVEVWFGDGHVRH